MQQIRFEDDLWRPVDENGDVIESEGVQITTLGTVMPVAWYLGTFFNCDSESKSLVFLSGLNYENDDAERVNRYRFRIHYRVRLIGGDVDIDDYDTKSIPSASLDVQNRVSGNVVGSVSLKKFYDASIDIPYDGQEFEVIFNLESLFDDEEIYRSAGQRIIRFYAPPSLNIVPPSTFYLNGLNEFVAPIGSPYTSIISGAISSQRYGYGGIAMPVRNENYPYVVSGSETNSIFWYPELWSDSDDGTSYRYSLKCVLQVSDPNDPEYMVTLVNQSVTGTAVFAEEDDYSYASASVSFSDPSGLFETYGVLLRNTESQVLTSVTLNLRYGAMVRAYIVPYGSNQEVEIYSGNAPQVLTYLQEIPTSGNRVSTSANVRIWGHYFANVSFAQDVIDYALPAFTNLAVHRCNADGSSNDVGSYCRIEWGIVITSINNENSKKLKIVHPAGETDYDPLTSYVESGSLVVVASTESAYTISFTLTDDLNSVERSVSLSTAGTIMDWLYGGLGISFGKVAEMSEAVDINPEWTLICQKMMYAGINLTDWIKDIAVRIRALEQFLSNSASSTQFEVSFYNQYDLYDRQWVMSGEDAEEPEGVPEKESTQQYSYAFAGWALTQGASAADPDALSNITSYRALYAAFVQTLRAYNVYYYHGSELLQEFDSVNYGASAAYSGSVPSEEGKTFISFVPHGDFVDGVLESQAAFYDVSEVSDDWGTIINKCNQGIAADEYNLGQYKDLDLGTEGVIRMQIVGKKVDSIGGGRKAQLTWVAQNVLTTPVHLNDTDIQMEYRPVPSDSFEVFLFERQYASLNTEEDTTGSIKVSAVSTASGTATIQYWCENAYDNQAIEVKVNGSVVVSGYNSTAVGSYAVSVESGDNVVIEVSYYAGEAVVSANCRFSVNESVSGVFDWSSRVVTIGKYGKPYIKNYVNGTGGIGGWEYWSVREYLQETIRPLIPAVVMNGIKSVKKVSAAWQSEVVTSTTEAVNAGVVAGFCTTYDSLWIPSAKEMIGSYLAGQYGLPEYASNADTRGKTSPGSSTKRSWWMRDAMVKNANPTLNNSRSGVYCGTNGAVNFATATNILTNNYYLVLGFCT